MLENCANFTQTDIKTGVTGEHACADGLLFDVTLCVCNWAENVTCGANVTAETKSSALPDDSSLAKSDSKSPEKLSTPGTCNRKGNLYEALGDCSKFRQTNLKDGDSGVVDCPAGLLFDTKICICNWPEQTICNPDYQ